MRRALEAQNPDIVFDWRKIVETPIPSAETERWRERRRAEKAEKAARRAEAAAEAAAAGGEAAVEAIEEGQIPERDDSSLEERAAGADDAVLELGSDDDPHAGETPG